MRLNKRGILPIIIFSIVIANLIVWGYVLLIKKNRLQDTSVRNSSFGIIYNKIKMPFFRLKVEKGDVITLENLDAKLNILIFFNLEDCPICLFEAEFWGDVSHLYPGKEVSLWGIITNKNPVKMKEFLESYRISFPILFDKHGSLKKRILSCGEIAKMNIISPFKVFVNRNHEIFFIEGPTKEAEKQKLFPERVRKLLNDL